MTRSVDPTIAPPRPRHTPARGACAFVKLPHRSLWRTARALIGRAPGVAFLDSGGPDETACWRILAWRPRRVVAWPSDRPGVMERLAKLLRPHSNAPAGSPLPFHGGWIGWFAYDLGRHVERLPSIARADPDVPDFVLGRYDVVLLEDRRSEELFVAGRCNDGRGKAGLRRHAAQMFAFADAAASTAPTAGSTGEPRPAADRDTYRNRVEQVLRHIRDGSVYQVNLSHRFTASSSEPSGAIYARLRAASPAPYGCYMGLPGGPEILSVSPELFLRRAGDRIETRPIKGTRARHPDPLRDAALLAELRDSAKERAELLMITDLLRNDLGKVARYGTVRVDDLRSLESHPTVHHASSRISAELRDPTDIAALLAATLPGGSVTGAPKIRAMQIIDELEPVRRGPYTGAAGYVGHDGALCLNILIRTLVRHGPGIHYNVGGGIVADSDADAEYDETLAKAAALHRALSATPLGGSAASESGPPAVRA